MKPLAVPRATRGLHNTWEPLLVMPARQLQPGFRNWLSSPPARGGDSDLIGRKPLAFCVWLFRCLGLLPGDEFSDLYPGSGVVSRAWREVSSSGDAYRAAYSDASTAGDNDALHEVLGDASLPAAGDAFARATSDASLLEPVNASSLEDALRVQRRTTRRP